MCPDNLQRAARRWANTDPAYGPLAWLASAAWPHRRSFPVLPGADRSGQSCASSIDCPILWAGPEDPRDERLRHGTLLFASVLIALISLIWVATYFAYGYPMSAAIPARYQLTTVVGLVMLARTRRFGVFRTTQLLAFLVLPALLQASLGGFVASSALILWAIFTPLAALALQGLRRSVVWFVAFFAELVVLALLDPRLSQDPAALPTGLVITFFLFNVVGLRQRGPCQQAVGEDA